MMDHSPTSRRNEVTYSIALDKATDSPRIHLPLTSWLAIGLCLLWWLAAVAGIQNGYLGSLQQNPVYRILSGGLLALYVLYQWRLSLFRALGKARKAKVQYLRHTWAGALSPLLLLMHTGTLGYGYLALLSVLFLSNTVIGALHPGAVVSRTRIYRTLWLQVHVLLSVCLTAVILFHVYVVIRYS